MAAAQGGRTVPGPAGNPQAIRVTTCGGGVGPRLGILNWGLSRGRHWELRCHRPRRALGVDLRRRRRRMSPGLVSRFAFNLNLNLKVS